MLSIPSQNLAKPQAWLNPEDTICRLNQERFRKNELLKSRLHRLLDEVDQIKEDILQNTSAHKCVADKHNTLHQKICQVDLSEDRIWKHVANNGVCQNKRNMSKGILSLQNRSKAWLNPDDTIYRMKKAAHGDPTAKQRANLKKLAVLRDGFTAKLQYINALRDRFKAKYEESVNKLNIAQNEIDQIKKEISPTQPSVNRAQHTVGFTKESEYTENEPKIETWYRDSRNWTWVLDFAVIAEAIQKTKMNGLLTPAESI